MTIPDEVWVGYGTRPEVIKLSPVVAAIRDCPGLRCRTVFTGQHADLAPALFGSMDMEPDVRLDIMRPNQTLEEAGARCLKEMGEVLAEGQPELLLVQGDTTTVLFSSLAAYFHKLPVGHVEAGLRTYNKFSPYPEELMRRLTGDVADLHFAPTRKAARNLEKEGIEPSSIYVTGNPVVDAARRAGKRAKHEVTSRFIEQVADRVPYVLVTLHRREHHDSALARIVEALAEFRERHPSLSVLFPVHPNPVVRRIVEKGLGGIDGVELMDPVGYFEMIYLLEHARLVFTDSGGIQEEAVALGRVTVVARENTERPEGLQTGLLSLAGTDPDGIQRALDEALQVTVEGTAGLEDSPYGDGEASARIADIVRASLTGQARRTKDWSGFVG